MILFSHQEDLNSIDLDHNHKQKSWKTQDDACYLVCLGSDENIDLLGVSFGVPGRDGTEADWWPWP